jgi:hypothetical protein
MLRFFIKMCFALSLFFLTIFHSSTYSMSHNTSAEIQLVLHCLRMNNCISIRAQISAVVRACSNWTLSPAQLSKQYSKKRCYHHWYIGQTFATCRYLPPRDNSALVQILTTVHFPLSVNVTQGKEFNLLRSHDSFTLDKQIRNVC